MHLVRPPVGLQFVSILHKDVNVFYNDLPISISTKLPSITKILQKLLAQE